MDILIVMCIGILVGRVSILRRAKKKNEYLSLFCTFILIFSMGVMLGKKDHFFEELSSLFPYTDRAFYRIGLLADKSFYEER